MTVGFDVYAYLLFVLPSFFLGEFVVARLLNLFCKLAWNLWLPELCFTCRSDYILTVFFSSDVFELLVSK
jgi:hypothetical protein